MASKLRSKNKSQQKRSRFSQSFYQQCDIIYHYYYLAQPSMKKYKFSEDQDGEQGFQRNPILSQEIIVESKKIEEAQSYHPNFMISTYKGRNRYKSSEKHNIKLANLTPSINQVSRLQRNSNPHVSLQQINGQSQRESNLLLKRKLLKQERKAQFSSIEQLLQSVIIKNKKVEVAQNLSLNITNQQQTQVIKQEIIKYPSSVLAFKEKTYNNTYSYFKHLLKSSKDHSFINSKYNILLKNKLEKSKYFADILGSKLEKTAEKKNCFEFQGDFQSGNIDFALKINQQEFNIFLKIDTNTKGHQSWFYFKAINRHSEAKTIKLNICNIKRKFKLMEKGQKVYIKTQPSSEWKIINQEIEVSKTALRRYNISFQLTFKANQEIYVSLIPPYTYSNVLRDVEEYNKSGDVKVDILTHSITGLAIPVLTITKDAYSQSKSKAMKKRRVFLISGRIHPSQTCSSFIINGLIKQILDGSQRNEQFLRNNILKVIPMLNPDGVVFGNFRTNYLGDDLNRSFHKNDQSVYPETIALKELGKCLQTEFAQNFIGFIDMHGHSCQTNSFVYGPQHQENSQLYTECRIFPKIIDKLSKYFKYEMSEFRLPEYKSNTARGYFLKRLKVPSYTVETSYSLYYEKDRTQEVPVQMSTSQWYQLGKQMANSFYYYFKYLESNKETVQKNIIKKIKQLKKANETNNLRKNQASFLTLDFQNLKKQIIKEAQEKPKTLKRKEQSSSQSDGESGEQDLPQKQKQQLIKSVKAMIIVSCSLPKVIKASLALPSVVPSIMAPGNSQQKIISTIPYLVNKIRQKKLVRPFNITHQYTQYLLKNIQGIGSLKPEIINYSKITKSKAQNLKNMFQDV